MTEGWGRWVKEGESRMDEEELRFKDGRYMIDDSYLREEGCE